MREYGVEEKKMLTLMRLGKWVDRVKRFNPMYAKLRPTNSIDKAMAYSLPRMGMLAIYTTDARLNIDNNPVENAIRPIAIGRKNYLFA